MSVRMGLLVLLEAGPSHGYELKSSFEARTGGVWTVNVGQVYSTLERLEADGLVEALPPEADPEAPGRDRRPWRITEAGIEAVDDWFEDVAVAAVPPRDEFLAKVLLACGRSTEHALSVIDRQRTELYRLARSSRREGTARRSARGGAGTDDPLAALAGELMAEIVSARHEADLRWLDHCEAVLLSNRTREGIR